MMDEIDVRYRAEKLLARARSKIERGQPFNPTAYYLHGDKVLEVTPNDLPTEAKDAFAFFIQKLAKEQKVPVVFIADSWMAEGKLSEEEQRLMQRGGVASLPKRMEALSVEIFGEGVKPQNGIQIYERDSAGRIRWKKAEWSDKFSSRFSGLDTTGKAS